MIVKGLKAKVGGLERTLTVIREIGASFSFACNGFRILRAGSSGAMTEKSVDIGTEQLVASKFVGVLDWPSHVEFPSLLKSKLHTEISCNLL